MFLDEPKKKKSKPTASTLLQLDSPDISPETKTALNKKISLIESKINSADISPSAISQSTLSEIEKLLSDADSLYRDMEVELSTYSKKTKERYNLPNLKVKLSSLRNKFAELESFASKKGYELDDEDKEKLISAHKDIDEGNMKMAESIRIMSNVNQTDKDTMRSLKNQTTTLINTTNILSEADSYIKKSAKVVNSMINRAMTNKVIMIGIVIMLGIINILLIYYKLKNKFK